MEGMNITLKFMMNFLKIRCRQVDCSTNGGLEWCATINQIIKILIFIYVIKQKYWKSVEELDKNSSIVEALRNNEFVEEILLMNFRKW
jgi:MoCo/4Fe-4S cofactor protein with predicted Tat translocation signal